MQGFKEISMEIKGTVGILTLNRPQKLNALGKIIIDELAKVVDELANIKELRVLIVTGAGGNFSSGLDVVDMTEVEESHGLRLIRASSKVYESIYNLNAVTIAAVEGYCLGGGLELALSCDLLVASKKSFFGEPEISFSVLPGIVRVWRHSGLNRARYMAMTGDIFSTNEVKDWGIISKMVDQGKALKEARKIADRLLEKPEKALKTLKSLYRKVMEMDYKEASLVEKEAFLELFQTEERIERMKAFKKKSALNK